MAGTAHAPTPRYNAERRLLRCAREGERCVCAPTRSGKKPTIRAEVLRALMLGLYGPDSLAPGWLAIRNARITGALDLSGHKSRVGIDAPLPHLFAYDCIFDERVDLSGARFDGLWLRRCTLPRLDIPGAVIDGDLSLNGSTINGLNGRAVLGDRVEIEGGVFLRAEGDRRFEAKGEVRLPGARVGGGLDASGASLDGDGGPALSCDGAEIAGDVFLRVAGGQRFEAKGEVRLLGVRVGGNLEAGGASLDGAGGVALSCDRAKIEGDVFLGVEDGRRFEAKGMVCLPGARVGGDLSASGASLDGAGGYALVCEAAEIKGSVALCGEGEQRFWAKGALNLPAIKVGAGFFLYEADLAPDKNGLCLLLGHARIERRLQVRDVRAAPAKDGGESRAHPAGRFDLSGAHAGMIVDDPKTGWPERGKLNLDGFTYDTVEFPPDGTDKAKSRLKWLDLQYSDPPEPWQFRPQPYEQLEKTFRAMGYGDEADAVAIAKRNRRLECRLDPGWRRVVQRTLGVVAGYGYSLKRAVAWTLMWWAIGTTFITLGLGSGSIQFFPTNPTSDHIATDYVVGFESPEVPIAHSSNGCPTVVVPLYALDLIIPVLDLGQESACRLETHGGLGGVIQTIRVAYEIIGAILTSALAATLAGLLRKD